MLLNISKVVGYWLAHPNVYLNATEFGHDYHFNVQSDPL